MKDLNGRPEETERNGQGVRIGVYVCHCGGNISDVVDVDRVAAEAGRIPGVAVSRTHMFMCSDPGQKLIQEDIQSGLVDRVVVAACSRSLHQATFSSLLARNGLNPYLLQQANIREQCSWAHHGQKEATAKAATLVRAAIGKARRLVALEPVRVDSTSRALVIGGGVAGMRAALDLARLGLKVALVERGKILGGFARRLETLFPDDEPAQEMLSRLTEAVCHHPDIAVYTDSAVTSVQGYIGNFSASVLSHSSPDAEPVRIEAGAIVVATGFRPYEPAKKELGYKKLSRVLTLPEFNELIASVPSSAGALEFEGKAVRSVGFVHCVGSRQVEGVHTPGKNGSLNRYCSRVCCTAALHSACGLLRRFPQIEIHDFYQDIRTYGRGHEEYYERASRGDVIFHRYRSEKPPKVEKGADAEAGPVEVTVEDGLIAGEEIVVGVDILVLVVGMVPADNATLIDNLKLAVSSDGFLQEVHPKLRPVEMAVNGVLLAGACQAPKDITESCASASAAAIKASAILRKGYVLLDPYVARVDLSRCKGSGLCVEECPVEGALHMTGEGEGRHVEVNPAICNGCGCCVAVCPSQAIQVNGWTLDQYESMVDAIVAPAAEVVS